MRGDDEQSGHLFSYLSPEQRVRADHPLLAIRTITNCVFAELSLRFTKMYSDIGRPSIPPEQLLRVLLLQSLYTQQQVLALGRLGWPASRIAAAVHVDRATVTGYLRAAGLAVRGRGRPSEGSANAAITPEVTARPGTTSA